MPTRRLGSLALCAALALAGCGASKAPAPTAPTRGTILASVASPPSTVQAILVTVTAADISGDVRASMTRDLEGNWSGRVLNVPPGSLRTVTVYAYENTSAHADPTTDLGGLIYRGSRTNVVVVAGQLAYVPVLLLPYPDGGGGIGLNTPPHLTGVSRPDAIASNAPASLTATAIDPDAVAMLTYHWDVTAGSFDAPDSGSLLSGQSVTVQYTPPQDFVGTVTIQLTVSDGIASAATSFPLAVGSGVTPVIVFDVLPTIAILGVQTQELAQGGSSWIDWQLAYPFDPGAATPPQVGVTATWSDDCGGSFSPNGVPLTVFAGETTESQRVTYTAPSGSPDLQQCNLMLTLRDDFDATVWSKVVMWVNPGDVVSPPADFTGSWSGLVTDANIGQYTLALELSQAADVVTGTFSNGFGTGTVSGTVSGATLSYTVDIQTPGFCTGSLAGTANLDGGLTTLSIGYTGGTVCNGPLSGSGALAKAAPPALDGKVVFITNSPHDGNFGSQAAADALCQVHADSGSGPFRPPTGVYHAFISFAGSDARDHIADGQYVLADGTLVASSKTDLLDGTLHHAIDMDENGAGGISRDVWTGTTASGVLDQKYDQCHNWTSNAYGGGDLAIAGQSASTGSTWVWVDGAGDNGWWCSDAKALYCFQQ